MRKRATLALSTCLALAGAVVVAPSASAATAPDLATAILANPGVIAGSALVTDASTAKPTSSSLVATTPLAGFPREGSTYAILSTGNAAAAYSAQSVNASTSYSSTLSRSTGGSDRDATVLRIDLNVPPSANCLLGVEFRFLSEEYPQYVGGTVNDGFIAEVDQSTWTTANGVITAPNNFAFDPNGRVISINSAGETVLNAAGAAGTVYGGGTDVLTAKTPLTPGPHSLFFSIFDQGDSVYDTAVLIDNLRVGHVGNVATDCQSGAGSAPDVPLLQAQPAPVTFADPYGTADDTYTIPTTTGVDYQVGGVTTPAGTHPGTGTVTVEAVAQSGYELTGATTFTQTYTDVRQVTAEAPTSDDPFGTADDTYTIPTVEGVTYQVVGVTKPAGSYAGTGTVVVDAVAQPNYVLTGPTSFSLPFTDIRQVMAQEPGQADEYGTADDTYTVPTTEGVRYEVAGAPVASGPHSTDDALSVTVDAVAEAGYVLNGASSFTLSYTDIRLASAVQPSSVDDYGTAADTYTIPTVLGVHYEIGGVTVPAGTSVRDAGTPALTVHAVADPGFVLTGPASFDLTWTNVLQVTPVAPTSTDPYATADDVYTIPAVEGVRYEVDGTTVAAGPHPGSGTVVVTAVAEDGYELDGPSSFTLQFSDVRLVSAEAPTKADPYGTADDSYTIPVTEGVEYLVGGGVVAAGTYPGTGTVMVTARAASAAYVLSGATEFDLPFTNVLQATPVSPTVADPLGTTDDTFTVASTTGVRYLVDGDEVLAGTYPGDLAGVVVTAEPVDGYELAGPTSFALVWTDIHPATATAPPAADPGGTAHDTFTIPVTEGVSYYVDGLLVRPGTYPATGTVVVTAVANDGFELQGPAEFTYVFATAATPVSVTTPDLLVTPSVSQTAGRYTIPAVEGVTFFVNGVEVPPGTYAGTGTVVITLSAQDGYELTGPSTLTVDLGTPAVPVPATPLVAVPLASTLPVTTAAAPTTGSAVQPTTDAAALPRTGTDPRGLLGLGLALLLSGAGALVVSRRRQEG